MIDRSSDGKLDHRLKAVYDNPDDKRQLFDRWASTYDHDLVDEFGYVADAVAVNRLIDRVPDRSACILDVGCGTGLVGRRLAAAGYDNIDGNDYSEEMIKQAETFGVYQHLTTHDITQPVRPVRPYDAAICVGVFAFSIPAAEHLINVIDCVKTGGPALVTVNGKAWREKNWQQALDDFLEQNPAVSLESIETIDYLTAQHIDGRLLVLHKTETTS